MKKIILLFVAVCFIFLSFSVLAHVFKQNEKASDREPDIPGVLYIDGNPIDSMTDYKYHGRVGYFTKNGVTYYGILYNATSFGWVDVPFNLATDFGYEFSKKATCDMDEFFGPTKNPDHDAAGFANYTITSLRENGMKDSGWSFIVFFETSEGALNSRSICEELESKCDLLLKYTDPVIPEGPGAE